MTKTYAEKKQMHERMYAKYKRFDTGEGATDKQKAFVQFAETGKKNPDDFDGYAREPLPKDVQQIALYMQEWETCLNKDAPAAAPSVA